MKITYIPEGSKRGIQGEKTYNIPFGMVLLDKNKEVFWKEKGLEFSRSVVKSKLDAILNHE